MTTDTSAKADGGIGVDRLFETGAHFAQVKSRRHPSMKPFVIGTKSKVEIFDLQKTDEQLAKAKQAMGALARDGKTVLFVGGKREVSDSVREAARRIGQPYVAGRWLGGTLSNFVEIKKRIDRLSDLTQKRESGELAKIYTKLERVFIDREITRLEERLGGIAALAKRPDAMVIVDTKHEAHASKEARDAGIPVIGIMSSDCDLTDAAFPIVVNDASRATVKLVLDELATAFETGSKA
ncbi:MAG: small subunit ribosomal protein [Candidatus Parcubacteria bacterium]|nr:small subunit ribosomal protein [Candidatus Parcubacteria bacterium]